MRKTWLIIGYGNPLCGDDAIGILAAEALETLFADDDRITVTTAFQLLPEMALDLAQVEFALFIDASIEGTPGEIRIESVTPEPPGVYVGHALTPAALIGLANTLYGARAAATLATVSGSQFDLGSVVSTIVSAALPTLIEQCAAMMQAD